MRRVLALLALPISAAAFAVGALSESVPTHRASLEVPWWVLAVALALAEARPLWFATRATTHRCTLSDFVLTIGFFSVPPRQLVFSALVGSVAGSLLATPNLRKATTDMTGRVLTTTVAILVFTVAAGPSSPLSARSWAAALGAILAAHATWFLLEVLRRCAHLAEDLFATVFACASTTLALVMMIMCARSAMPALLAIGPTIVLVIAYHAYSRARRRLDDLQFLFTTSEQLSSETDLDVAFSAVLPLVRAHFDVDLAELVLQGDPGDLFGVDITVTRNRAATFEPVAMEDVWDVIAVASRTSVSRIAAKRTRPLAPRQGLPVGSLLVARVEDEIGVRGALVLVRAPGEARFTKHDLRLVETLANHVEHSLERGRLAISLARLREAQRELAYQARHDSLTGLANRALFQAQLDKAIVESTADGTRVGVMLIDLDDFKTVNDTKGHAAGDELLREVGRRLSRAVGSRAIAARIGGDEFAVLLRDITHASQVQLIAQSIIASLRVPIEIEGDAVTPMASIGVAVHTFEADAGELLKRADVAMYTAKRNGKGRFEEFQASMSLNSTDRHQLRLDLQRAVADQDFTLEFQPVLAIASGEIEGVEALLRWRDPRRGPQRAADFVTVAEETGLIIPIGRMVVHAACRQAAVWLARFPEIRVFVNVSARELAHREIVNVVGAALAMSRLEPSHLVLEVTETAMMRDIDEAKEVLYALKALGVGLAIDDFGTGFSSLSYLRDLPIDVLKIAKPIIAGICDSPRDTAFVRGIVELGHVVGARVVAEGVEHLEQHSEVIAAGCDYAQGYYYAPPMTADGIVQVLQTSVEARRLLGQLSASS